MWNYTRKMAIVSWSMILWRGVTLCIDKRSGEWFDGITAEATARPPRRARWCRDDEHQDLFPASAAILPCCGGGENSRRCWGFSHDYCQHRLIQRTYVYIQVATVLVARDRIAVKVGQVIFSLHFFRFIFSLHHYYHFLTPVLNSQGMKKVRYAIQKSTKIKLEWILLLLILLIIIIIIIIMNK